MSKSAALETTDGLLIVSEDRKTLKELHADTRTALAHQAAFASRFTGLSLDYCAKMVLRRAAKRLQG